MEAGTEEHEVRAQMRDAELATVYAGPDANAGQPLLVEPWDAWEADSELDPQIYAALLRLAP